MKTFLFTVSLINTTIVNVSFFHLNEFFSENKLFLICFHNLELFIFLKNIYRNIENPKKKKKNKKKSENLNSLDICDKTLN